MSTFLARFFVVFALVFGTLFLLVWFYLSVTSPAQAAERAPETQTVTFEVRSLRVLMQYGGAHDFTVEVASTPDQLRQGLMHRTELAPNKGMLFVYKPPRTVGMWMKNTLISLDMLFADRLGRIIFIAENTQPMSEDIIQAPGRTAYVLEVPAGTVKQLSIGLGQRLTF
ncbi:MAG: DUF192 domain-containing protein [Magnetovibrio sp.]|nr:DUF192 domain-containing protein [Magnetovibrio sp.]